MNEIRALASGALMLAVAGCAVFRAPEDAPPVPAEPEAPAPAPGPATIEPAPPAAPGPAERLLDYFRQLRRMGGGELGQEHESARVAYLRSRSDFDRVRFAMVLSLPETALNNEARALELLEPVAKNPNSPLHALALLLQTFVQEARRQERNVQGIQQKLDALKAMERTLIERKR